jgi:hypothetical protein
MTLPDTIRFVTNDPVKAVFSSGMSKHHHNSLPSRVKSKVIYVGKQTIMVVLILPAVPPVIFETKTGFCILMFGTAVF